MDQDLTNMAANFLGFYWKLLRYMEQHWELLVNDIEQGTIDLGIKLRGSPFQSLKENSAQPGERRRN